MVNSRNKNSQKVVQERRLFLPIERQSFVVTLSEVMIFKLTSQRWRLAQLRP
jgi:hypothetical protein